MSNNLTQSIIRKLFGRVLNRMSCRKNFSYDYGTYFPNCLDGRMGGVKIDFLPLYC